MINRGKAMRINVESDGSRWMHSRDVESFHAPCSSDDATTGVGPRSKIPADLRQPSACATYRPHISHTGKGLISNVHFALCTLQVKVFEMKILHSKRVKKKATILWRFCMPDPSQSAQHQSLYRRSASLRPISLQEQSSTKCLQESLQTP